MKDQQALRYNIMNQVDRNNGYCSENVNISVNGLFGKYSRIEQRFFYVGQAFYQDSMLSTQALYSLVCSAYDKGELLGLLTELSGFYAFLLNENSTFIAVCDRTRSRPLFYALENGVSYLSDSAQWIIEQLPQIEINNLSEQELAQAGYVSGSNTLVKQLMQIPAGTYLQKTLMGFELVNYYHFMPLNNGIKSEKSTLYTELDKVMKQSIEQLITYANGRQLVVPLSGGYDSRSIAIYLKEANYKNIISFTFGKANSKEVMISKNVADALGFEWHVVEYTRSLWKYIKNSQLFNQYLSFISSYVSVPNVQVYPAIKSLVDRRIIDKDAIIVPGHTGDFTSGGHIPVKLSGLTAKSNECEIVDTIIKRHYRNKTRLNDRDALVKKLTAQIQELIDKSDMTMSAISIFESWEFAERQAKFIVNSNRYYDFFKLDWWMPLWHENVAGFWEKAPLKQRLKSKMWQSFVEEKYVEVSGDHFTYGNVTDQYHPIIKRIRDIFDYFTDDNRLYSIMPFYYWFLGKIKYPYANSTLFSYLASEIIRKYKKQLRSKS